MQFEIYLLVPIAIGFFLGWIQVWTMSRVGRVLVDRAGESGSSGGADNMLIIMRYMVFLVVFGGSLMLFKDNALIFLVGLFLGFGLALVRLVRSSK